MAKILIIDDSTFEANHVKTLLEQMGHEVLWAETGSRGIKIIKLDRPNLIILDLVLPDISGMEICRWVKQDMRMKNTPVIMLTARGEVQERVEGLTEGATDYIAKPFDDAELSSRVIAVLREVELRDRLELKNMEYEELLKRLEKMSITDTLTGLYNRRHFEDVVVAEFERFKRYNIPFSCMMIDVDKFKDVNDQCGHDVGDTVLKNVAHLIQGQVRGVDTAARYGGDEFVILLAQLRGESAERVAFRMLSAANMQNYQEVDPRLSKITLSIGIAGVPDADLKTIDQLVKSADQALYKAKNGGRNCYKIASVKEIGEISSAT
ncbi:MAG: diguanylate cyclase [Nitrospirae bacterium]|nr:diguanylate cyclase [Candidatus Troglogloeales bacterium]